MDEKEDSLGAEDPAIEIARLLRPKEARTPTKPDDQPPRPTTEVDVTPPVARTSQTAPAGRNPTEPEPLLLGTNETPLIGGRDKATSMPLPGADGRSYAGQASRRTGLARRASNVAASDRTAAGAQSDQDRSSVPPPGDTAMPPPGDTGDRPETPAAATSFGPETEPLGEALPKCLTEPWDDPDPGWLQAGQDKSARRWPFRRGRSGRDAADREDQERPAPRGARTHPGDGTERPK